MSGFKETEIGLVPESWEIVPLEQTGEVVYGIQAAVANLTKPIGTKILTNINITFDGKINLNQLRYYPLTKARHFKTVLKKGDILFNWRSGSKDHVGKTAFFDLDGEFTHASFILRIRTNDKVVNKYLFYYLTYLRSSGYFRKLQNYSVNAKFNASAVNALPTAVPPYKEQQNITHILSKIQSAIETQEKIIQTTKELKKALMQKLFTEGLNGEQQKETEIGLVPRSWEVKRIEEAYNFTNKPRGTDLGVVNQVPFIPMDLIPDDGLFVRDFELRDVDDLSSGTYIENGDLLIAKITPSFENGKQAIVNFEYKFGFATTEVLPIKEKARISNKHYLYYYLLKNDVRSMLAGKMEGSTGRQRLSKTVLGETLIPCPSYKEQTEIAEMFIKVDNKIQFCKTKVVSLQSLFKSMLHHLMTGQIRVKDLKVS